MDKSKLNQTLGSYLKEKRTAAKLTQLEVARKLGYSSPQFISNFERGLCSPPLKQLKKITKLYKINPNEIIEFMMNDQQARLNKTFFGRKKIG